MRHGRNGTCGLSAVGPEVTKVPFCGSSSIMPAMLPWLAVGPGADVGCCTDFSGSIDDRLVQKCPVSDWLNREGTPPLTTRLKCLHSRVNTLLSPRFDKINPSRAQRSLYVPPSGHYMYRQFNIQQLYVLPTQLYLCVLCGSENKEPLFPYTTLTDWFYKRDLTL